MQKRHSRFILILSSLAASMLLAVACGPTGQQTAQKESTAVPEKQAASGEGAAIYQMDIKPLSPVECGRCHSFQYSWLRDEGGRHQMDCTVCHEKFHAYNPKKDNWDEIMPDCQNCHDLPHAPQSGQFTACMECHQQPHAPKVIRFADLEKTVTTDGGEKVVCAVCHDAVGTEFDRNPSLHNSELNCQGCHMDKHGTIPSCFDCHDPHLETQVYQDCLVCHSPHSATNIKQYPEDVPNTACGACHDSVYESLQTNITAHSALQCATCHVSHGMIPQCEDCHGKPHGEGLHQRFAACVECHVDPHNLPVNLHK